MGLLVQKSDFVGKYALALSINDKVDDYIELYEERYLRECLGIELFDAFKNDVEDYLPQTEKYLTLYNKIFFVEFGEFFASQGMKEMLLGFIYFEYVRDSSIAQSMVGGVATQAETAQMVGYNYLYQRYNEAVYSYQTIQLYIQNHKDDYGYFTGVSKKIANWL